MNGRIERRRVLHGGLALAAASWIPRARAHEVITTHLRVTHPWAWAAARAEPFAVLCMSFDEVSESDRLVRVASPVASNADMGGLQAGPTVDFLIPKGKVTYLSEATTYVRLTGLKQDVEFGRSYPLVLGFEKGGVYLTTFGVDQTGAR